MRDLRELLAGPTGCADATPEEAAAALREATALLSTLTSRLSLVQSATKQDTQVGGDRLLTAAEAANRLGVSPRWLRGRALPFRVRVSPRRVRYSESGLGRYLKRKSFT